MALALTQVITEDRASGGQVIDGSLRFVHGNTQYLERTPGSAGNRRTFTWSAWIKRGDLGAYHSLFCGAQDSSNLDYFFFWTDDRLALRDYNGTTYDVISTAKFRDPSAWYHIVLSVDTTQSTAANRVRFYVNGTELTDFDTSTYPAQNYDFHINNTDEQYVGYNRFNEHDGLMSQVYLVDGQQLAPTEFGFTDPLTNTWRPKKYTGTFGTNGFWLPLDGNSPIGEDKSGNGNDFTPVNFGGSNSIEKATGALPILNTVNGGRVATVGVRSDSTVGAAATCILALPLVGNTLDVSHVVDSKGTERTITVSGPTATSAHSNFYGGSYSFDGSNDELSFSVTNNGLFFLQTDFTIECWARVASGQTDDRYFIQLGSGISANSDTSWFLRINSSKFEGAIVNANTQYKTISAENYVADKWTHVAYVREGNEQRLYVDGVLSATTSHTVLPNINDSSELRVGAQYGNNNPIDAEIQDVRIYTGVAKYTSNFIPASTDPDILPDTPSGTAYSSALTKITDGAVAFDGSGDYLSFATNSDFGLASGDDFTIECFTYATSYNNSTSYSEMIRQGTNNAGTDGIYFNINSTGTLSFRMSGTTKTTTGSVIIGGWNHVSVCRSSGTVYMSINGVVENFGSVTNSSTTGDFRIGADFEGNNFYKGQLSNVRFVKGTALYTSSFTPPTSALTNVTNTKLLCCQSTTSATAAAVTPGSITANGNAAASNFNPFTTDINAVRGQESGYATLNPLFPNPNGGTYSNGNLRIATAAGNGHYRANFAMSTGKWYWETTPVSGATPGIHGIGNDSVLPSQNPGQSSGSFGYYSVTGYKQTSGTDVAYGSTYTYGDVIGCAYDASNGKIYWSKNGVWQGGGDPVAGTNAAFTSATSTPYYPIFCAGSSSNTVTVDANFGQKPFKYNPPEGFQPLNAANVRPSTVIAHPDQYVGVTTFTGTGQGTTTTVSNLQFKPDFVWTKSRTGARNYGLYDSVRGINRKLYSSAIFAENTGTTLTSFDSNGFKLADGDDIVYYGESGVAWCWKAGGNSNTFNVDNVGYSTFTTAPGLNSGTIALTGASVGTTQGFSIIGYTGTASSGTISHGLGKIPSFIILKNRTFASGTNWQTYHKDVGNTSSTILNGTTTPNSDAGWWNNTSPTSSVFSVGSYNSSSEDDFIAYLWSDVPGLQKFGSYEGNGNANGPYIELGFRPAVVLIKNIDTGGTNYDWVLYDNERAKYNPDDKFLCPNLGKAENVRGDDTTDNARYVDFLSNGFKVRNNSSPVNASETIIYAAWAEAPTFNLYGAQSNAR